MARALANKMNKGGNKENKKNTPVNPLKFFNDNLEFRRMAMGGSMMNMGSIGTGFENQSSVNPETPRQRQRRLRRFNRKRNTGCTRKPMIGSAGEECMDDMA